MINIIFMITNLFIKSAVLSGNLLQIPMADTFRSEGKIYVLLGVVLVLLGGFFFYLFRIDRKVKKLEDDIHNQTRKS